jgi:hypothetical protein
VKSRWIAALAVVALAVSACGSASVFDLAVGDCFDDPVSGGEISSVTAVDCATPHDNEVYAVYDFDGTEYPGSGELTATADEGCESRFEDYVGIAYLDSALFYTHLVPTEESWGTGDREIVCVLYEPNEKLTGSMQGAAR